MVFFVVFLLGGIVVVFFLERLPRGLFLMSVSVCSAISMCMRRSVWGSRHNHFHYHRHRMISCCGGAALCTSVRCVSLSELAKAFAEMSESNATTPVSSTTNATAATQMASSLASSSIHNSRDSSMLSLEHDATLRALTGPRLSAALDAACRQNHRVHVMQCLTELCRRLREAPPSEFIITEDEASGAVGIVPDNAFRSDRLLEGILRALARSDLDAVVGKSGDWIAEFCALLMQWLCARAASLDAVKSGIFLHLLAQQKALHCEAALATLRDNVEVHLRRAVEGQGSGSGSGSSNNRGNGSHSRGSALDLSVYSVILDAIARWQLGVVRLIAMESSSVAARRDALDEVVTLNDYYDSNHGLHIHHNNGGAELHIAQCGHPVLSADFYNAVVSSLLRDVRSGSVSLTQRCSPTTFFFLTLALAKIRWLHTECVAVLLPQFHDALRVFPAQFLGVVLLLGRREVNVCDVATTDLLLQTVLDSMQRRGRSFAANPSSTAASGGSGSSNSSSSSGGGGSSSKGIHNRHQLDATAFRAVASGPKCSPAQSIAAVGAKETAMGGEDWCATGNEEDAWKQDDEDLLLFSPVARSSALSSSASSSSSSSLSSQALVPMTSLLDVRTLPVFLDSLRNILTTTIEHCAAQSRTAEAAAINAKAATLFEAIMRDTHNGVKSIQTLVDRPVMTEKLLNAFVRLPLEEHLFHHPLFVELTYAFTRHIGRRRSVLSSNAGKGIPLWQRRAAGLAELLVERGLLTQDTFLMSDAVVASAPRVAEAVAAEKERMQRIREERAGRTGVKTQQQQEEQQKQGEETSAVREDAAALKRIHTPVRTSAVFAGFSRVMRHIQHHLQQQREMTAQRGRVSV